MARKKRRPDKRSNKANQPSSLPDLRLMEHMMQQLTGGMQSQENRNTPLGKAQALMHLAFEETDPQRQVRLAQQALDMCPDCADAYVVLAEHARTRKESYRLYAEGVAAGERALGPAVFERDAGRFWGIVETRPYMRARFGLAHALWSAGKRELAVQHVQEMLRLNPNDNQAVRYTLAHFLLFLDRDAELAQLLQQHDEVSATWAYTKALLAFREGGDTPEARKLFAEARKINTHVPSYLIEEKPLPPSQPRFYRPGDENEAIYYVGGFLSAWKSTAGAIAWLRQNAFKKVEPPRPKGPLLLIKTWLNKNLSQEFDVWEAEVRQMPNWIRIAGEPIRPWLVLVLSRTTDLILSHATTDELPTPEFMWDTLVQAMQRPAAGQPHRPTELRVRADERWEALRPHLQEVGVAVVVADELAEIDAAFAEMTESICGKSRPGLLNIPGVTPAQIGSFYLAAAHFFRQAPWKRVGDIAAVRVECGKFQSGPWYAVIMGQSGLTIGLALYEDLAALQHLWTTDGTDEDSARLSVATSVTFGEEWTIPIPDSEAAKKYQWPVARPDAYPDIYHKERGLALRLPLLWELELMEACLRALPEFVARHTLDDPARDEITVPVASGTLTLVLSWVDEDDSGYP